MWLRLWRTLLLCSLVALLGWTLWTSEVSFAPVPATVYSRTTDQLRRSIVLNFPHNEEREMSSFLAMKEEEYAARRAAVKEACHAADSPTFGSMIWDNTLVYDDVHSVSYCMIAKVASSTWCRHFIQLADPPAAKVRKYRDALQLLAPQLWPPPPKRQLASAWAQTTSIVIVRHPMSRLASVYYQKFVELAGHLAWKRLNDYIVRVFGEKNRPANQSIVTPEEMLRYILTSMEKAPGNVDQHWRPQHNSCPFCLLNFTVYARQEELTEDTIYFLHQAGLETKLNVSQRLNVASSDDQEQHFWSRVEQATVARLLRPTAYRSDFLLFGYSARDYLAQLGLPCNYTIVDI